MGNNKYEYTRSNKKKRTTEEIAHIRNRPNKKFSSGNPTINDIPAVGVVKETGHEFIPKALRRQRRREVEERKLADKELIKEIGKKNRRLKREVWARMDDTEQRPKHLPRYRKTRYKKGG